MFPRIPETIEMLRKKGVPHSYQRDLQQSLIRLLGKKLVFVTNNSTKSRADYKKKFDKLGIEAYEVSRPAFLGSAVHRLINTEGRSLWVKLQRSNLYLSHPETRSTQEQSLRTR